MPAFELQLAIVDREIAMTALSRQATAPIYIKMLKIAAKDSPDDLMHTFLLFGRQPIGDRRLNQVAGIGGEMCLRLAGKDLM